MKLNEITRRAFLGAILGTAATVAMGQPHRPYDPNNDPWDKLHQGMTYGEVHALLGEPTRIKTWGEITNWEYGMATVRFWKGKLTDWSYPGAKKNRGPSHPK